MTIRWAHQNVDKWLKELNPEVALMMFGTNDLGSLELPEYETKTREVVQKCLDNGTILILSTIPPKHGQAEKAAAFAEAVRKIAREMKVPLTDYHAEILQRRPDDWDGAADQFQPVPGLRRADADLPRRRAPVESAEVRQRLLGGGTPQQRLRPPQLPRADEVRRGDREGVAEEAGAARTRPGGRSSSRISRARATGTGPSPTRTPRRRTSTSWKATATTSTSAGRSAWESESRRSPWPQTPI